LHKVASVCVLPGASSLNQPVLGIQQSLRVVKDSAGKVTVLGLRPGQLVQVVHIPLAAGVAAH